jgi:hypothetical protein
MIIQRMFSEKKKSEKDEKKAKAADFAKRIEETM